MDDLKIRPIDKSEAEAAVELVLRTFDEFIAQDYTPEGVKQFYTDVTPESLVEAIEGKNIALAGVMDGEIAGISEVRDTTHLSWLFVDKTFQSRGIARALVRSTVEEISRCQPAASKVTLNSSPYALPVYLHLGFVATGEERTINGMRMTPMEAEIMGLLV